LSESRDFKLFFSKENKLKILVFGGGVSQAGELLFKPFRESLQKHIFHPHYLDDLIITKAAMGDNAGLLGALALARLAMSQAKV
jgi:glucokinase